TANYAGNSSSIQLTATNQGYFSTTTTAFAVSNSGGAVTGKNIVLTPGKLAVTTISPATPTAGSAFSVTVQSQTATGTPRNVGPATTVTLSLNTGAGTLGGTLTGIIAAGANTVTISGVTYTKAESNEIGRAHV